MYVCTRVVYFCYKTVHCISRSVYMSFMCCKVCLVTMATNVKTMET